jgi:hypothetical protein
MVVSAYFLEPSVAVARIFAVPFASPVMTPFSSMLISFGVVVLQATSCQVASAGETLADACAKPPTPLRCE